MFDMSCAHAERLFSKVEEKWTAEGALSPAAVPEDYESFISASDLRGRLVREVLSS